MPAVKLTINAQMENNDITNINILKPTLDLIPCFILEEFHEEDDNAYLIYSITGQSNARIKFYFYPMHFKIQLYNDAVFVGDVYADNDFPGLMVMNIICSTNGVVFDVNYTNTLGCFAICLNGHGEWVIYNIPAGLAWDAAGFITHTLTNIYYPSIDGEGNYLLIPIRLVQGGNISTILPGLAYSVYAFTGNRSFLNLADGVHKAYYYSNKLFVV